MYEADFVFKNDLKRSYTVTRLMHGLVEKEQAACVKSDLCISIVVLVWQSYLRPYFRNNMTLLLTFHGYIDDIAVCSVTCLRMNEIYAKQVPDSDVAV